MKIQASEIVSWMKRNKPYAFSNFIQAPEKFPNTIGVAAKSILKKEIRIDHQYRTWFNKIIEEIKKQHETSSSNSTVEEDKQQHQPTNTHMSKYSAVPVATPTLVFGTDVTDLGPEACIATIKSNNAQIKDLEEAGIEGPYITNRVAGLKAANVALAERLNSLA